VRLATFTVAALAAAAIIAARPAAPLRIELVGSDSTAFNVVSALIIGPTEVLLWDAQYHVSDAKRVADRIAATGKRLKAIVLSHADHDHYMGAATIVERFPGTPVYMTAAALAEFTRTAKQQFPGEKARHPNEIPDSLVTPKVIPSNMLTVDGESIELIPDLTGDVITPTNSILWIPSLRTVLASDIAFNGVHPWLGSSDERSRAAWRKSLERIAALNPTSVIAGHKRDVASLDSPDVLRHMNDYLVDFDALKKTSANGTELATAMRKKYPDLAVGTLLNFSAQTAFRKAP
jgi:glyoxylase-like metal-dependent hydrolase (beta-lactamase superfamily II)